MKRKFTFLLMALLALAGFKSWGQETVEIGNGSVSSYYFPFNSYYNYSYNEMLYLADEIGTAGTITSISFYANGTTTKTYTLDIYMRNVNKTQFSSTQDFIHSSSEDLVWSGQISGNQSGWVTFELNTPFAYDGTHSLMIAFDNNSGTYGQWYFRHHDINLMAIAACSDANNQDPSSPNGYDQYGAKRPNIRINITPAGGCPKPKDLTASNVTATGATISWTDNGAESYDLAYGVASTFDLSNDATYELRSGLTATSEQLTGLIAETEYKCAVKAHCSGDDESAWSSVIAFMPSVFQHLTVNDGTDTYDKVPFYGDGAYFYKTKSQFVIPASDIEDMQGCEITQFKFYVSSSSSYNPDYTSHRWDVYVKEMDDPSGAWWDFYDFGTMTNVYSGSVSIVNNELTITLDEPFQYNNKSLMIGFNQTNTGFYGVTYWLGSNTNTSSAGTNRSRAGWENGNKKETKPFLPKTTFTYTPGATRYNVIVDNAITGGSISANPTEATAGTVVSLSATPAFGYEFGAWVENYEDVTIVDNQFTMPEHDVNISATFQELQKYAINCATLAEGTIHAEYDNVTITEAPAGTEITLVAETNPGYMLDQFVVNSEPIVGNTYIMPDSEITVSATFINAITVYNGTTTNKCTAVYTYYGDTYGSAAQFVVPAEQLTAMEGGEISSIKFYVDPNNISNLQNLGGPSYAGYITEVTETTMSSFIDFGSATTIFTGHVSLSNNNSELVIDFSTPYTYDGGNLAIAFVCTANSNWTTLNYYGTTVTGGGIYRNGSSGATSINFIPKTTFIYTPGATRYNITVTSDTEGCTASADMDKASAGTEVTLSHEADVFHTFVEWQSSDVTITDNTFEMPANDVSVTAHFAAKPTHSITAAVNPESAGTASVTYQSNTITEAPAGAVLNLSAIANPGFDFVSWTIGDEVISTSANYNYTMPDNNVAIVANFGEHQFLHVNIDPNIVGGTITVNPSECDPGATVTVTANAASGYQYMYGNITVTDANGQPVYVYQGTPSSTFEMPNTNVTVSATFSKSYYISIGTQQHCTVTTSPMGSTTANADVTVFVTPEEGYRVTNVTATYEGGQITAVYSGEWNDQFMYDFTMPAADVTVNVVCALTYTVSYTQPTGGTISVSPTTYVPAGQEVSIDITNIYDHYSFDYDNYESKISVKDASENPVTVNKEDNTHYNFTMPASNVTVSVTFDEAANYDIAVTQPEGCTIQVSPSENVYANETVYLSYYDVQTGYQFVEWVVNDGESTITPEFDYYYYSYYFTMPASENVTVTANVEALEVHTVNIAEGITGGSIIAYTDNDHEAPINAYENNLVYLNNTPESGYQFVSYTVTSECGTVEVYNNFYFYMPDCDVTVSATFIKPETLTVYDGTSSDDRFPIYTWWGDTQGTTSQFIIPAEKLEDMVGGTIKEMKFFISSGGDTGGQIWECRIKEVDYTVLTGIVDVSTLTPVYSGHYLSFANNEWNVTFDTPFAYSGKNLLVSFECTTKGTYKSNSFWGENVEYNASYSSREGVSTFIPKTEFTYLPDPTVVFYDIEIAQVEAGTITASKTRAKADTEIELSMNMNEGYTFSRWIVKDADSQDVTVTDNIFTMPASNVTVTAEYNTLPRYNVTLVPSVGGSITATPSENILEGTWVKLVATPDHGYRFVSWSGSTEAGGTLFIVDIETSGFTMRASNATVTATFEALPTYEVNYYANGLLVNTLTPYEGDDIDITPCEVPEGVNFYGWATSEIDETPYLTAAPSIITEGTPVDAAKNLYAVFSYSEQIPATGKDGETWVEVTSPSDLSSGDQVIFVEKNYNKVLTERTGEYDGCFRSADITIIDNEISSIPSNAVVFEAESVSESWKFWFEDAFRTGLTTLTDYSGGNLVPMNMGWGGSDSWTIISNGSSVNIQGGSGNYIVYKSGDFTVDGSSVYKKSVLFKKYNPVITNNYYMTSVLADGEVAANTTAKNIIITTGTVTVNNNIVLTMNESGLFRNENAAKFVFKDGAEFIYTGAETVNATFQKDIKGYNSVEASDGWYFIANPTANTTVNLGSSYDLYTFNPAAAAEWHNEQYNNGQPVAISRETGYLYANIDDFTLKFEGELIPSGEDQTIDLVYYDGVEPGREFPGFNLIGNPFPCTAYISGEFSIFKLNDDGSDVEISTDYTVAPCEAFFVEATADNKEVTLSTTAPEGKSRIMPIVVNSDRGETLDRAILHLEGTRNSHKFMMNPDRTNISFAKNGERFASVSRGDETEIPMNFTADHKGSYTISFNTENFEEEYLHLIDVVSGDNIDLLVTPSYTFEADADEYASRFRIVFGTTDINDDPATSSEPFVYISNGNLVINNVEGTASMQIVDMLGRIVRTETVCGSYNKPHNLKAGAYVITLDGRAQRIVIE